jgi:hypothetical protein
MSDVLDINVSGNDDIVSKYLQMMSSLTYGEKLAVVEKLISSVREGSRCKVDDMSFVSRLSGAWNDGTTVEEKIKDIRDASHRNITRDVESW